MKIIRNEEAEIGANSPTCKTKEYSFKDEALDLGLAKITGRYPEKGYCFNRISKELIYVLEGTGKLYFENKKVEFKKGDAILIEPNEKYYWESSDCTVSMSCTPAWNAEQHEIVE